MAKLSAHGQELMRLEKVNQVSDGTLSPVYKNSDGTESPSLTTWDRTTRAYMADGVILEKMDVRFRPDRFDPEGRLYSYGWKKSGRLKGTAGEPAVEQRAIMTEHIRRVRENITRQDLPVNPWKEVK